MEEKKELEIKKYGLFAISKKLAKAKKDERITLNEYKTLLYSLTKINFKSPCPNRVYMNTYELANFLGIKSDQKHILANLCRSVKNLSGHSAIDFELEEGDEFIGGGNGTLVNLCVITKYEAMIEFNSAFLGLLGNLASGEYITMWGEDIRKMTSVRSILFYEFLRINSNTKVTNYRTLTLREIRKILNIDPKMYYREVNGKKYFNYNSFEKKILDPICKDLEQGILHLVKNNEGKYYKRKLDNNDENNTTYSFCWEFDQEKIKKALNKKEENKNKQVLPQSNKQTSSQNNTYYKKVNNFNNFTQKEMTDDEIKELEKSFFENSLAHVTSD